MKASDVYRKAALLLERPVPDYSPYACDAIGYATGWFSDRCGWHLRPGGFERKRLEYCRLRDRFAELFGPRGIDSRGVVFFGAGRAANQDRRILALCFMAAIAEDEEKRRKASPRRKANGGKAK